MSRILVTGAAGFIGYHLAHRLLREGHAVVGIDAMVPYYDLRLKQARLAELAGLNGWQFCEGNLAERRVCETAFAERFDGVVHLAAQPGVRYSIDHPEAYVEHNLVAFANVLEGMRQQVKLAQANGVDAPHFVYASSSSVYGNNTELPFHEGANVDAPVSFYAATKKANELMAHSYAHLYGFAATGLRFFTVYGPWGRPDMAIYKFTRLIDRGESIPVYNHGQLVRDYTYIDDIIEGVVRVMRSTPPRHRGAHHVVYNIGNASDVPLLEFIQAIEKALGKKAHIEYQDMQPGDVLATRADVAALQLATGFVPSTPVEVGVQRFVDWYRLYERGMRREVV